MVKRKGVKLRREREIGLVDKANCFKQLCREEKWWKSSLIYVGSRTDQPVEPQ